MVDRAERLVYEIYRQSGFCEPSRRGIVEELQPWRERSIFHLVIDEDDEVLATMRSIVGTYETLPIGKFERTDFDHKNPMVEMSSLVVRPSNRGTGVLEHLYRAIWVNGLRMRMPTICGLVDPWLLEAFVGYYAFEFRQIGVPHFHMGADVIPIAWSLESESQHRLARRRPELFEWGTEAMSEQERIDWGLPAV